MNPNPSLGEFEQIVLLAVLRLGDEAYGVTILAEIAAKTGRNPSPGALYTTLHRMEDKGLVTFRDGSPTPERGGRAKRFVTVTREGRNALASAQSAYRSLLEGLDLLAAPTAGSHDHRGAVIVGNVLRQDRRRVLHIATLASLRSPQMGAPHLASEMWDWSGHCLRPHPQNSSSPVSPDPTRAAAIIGDLTEMAATRGRLWFWAAYPRTLISLGWRTPVAVFAIVISEKYIRSRGLFMLLLRPFSIHNWYEMHRLAMQHPFLSHFCLDGFPAGRIHAVVCICPTSWSVSVCAIA